MKPSFVVIRDPSGAFTQIGEICSSPETARETFDAAEGKGDVFIVPFSSARSRKLTPKKTASKKARS